MAELSDDDLKKKARTRTAILYGAGLVLGAALGFIENSAFVETMDFIALVFTRLFKFIAIPVIALALITTLAKLGKGSNSGTIFGHAVFYTLLTTILAASIGLALFLILSPANVPPEVSGAAELPNGTVPNESYMQHFISVIPDNFVAPFASGNVLSILIVAALFGLALTVMPEGDHKSTVLNFLKGIQDIFFILIHWLILALPIGILAFTAQLVHGILTQQALGSLVTYFTVVVGSNLIQMFIVLPLLLVIRGLNPLKVARGMFPALMVALFSKSSAGTLPVTMASAEDNLGVDRRVSRFVLPVCTTINMNGCAAFILVTSLYLMQNAGMDLSVPTMLVWILIATLAAVGNAGVPMGCFFLTLSLMASLDVPVRLMGIILPVYAVIDMIETCLNVWSDSSVCAIVNNDLKGKLPPQKPEEQAD